MSPQVNLLIPETQGNSEWQNSVAAHIFSHFSREKSIPGKPTCAKLSLEIRNSNNYRRMLKFSSFPVFFAVSVCTFWALDFFRHFVGFFRRFVGVFRRFKIGKHMLMTKNAKIVWQQKKVPPAIIPEKAIILHTLEDAGIACLRAKSLLPQPRTSCAKSGMYT